MSVNDQSGELSINLKYFSPNYPRKFTIYLVGITKGMKGGTKPIDIEIWYPFVNHPPTFNTTLPTINLKIKAAD